MTNIRGIKETILTTRKKKGFTQQDMAEKLNISQPAYSYYEKGDKPLPVKQLAKVVKILDLDPKDLEIESQDTLSDIHQSLIRIGDLLEEILKKM